MKFFGAAGAEVKTYATQDEANNDLAAGRIDYVQADASALEAFTKTEQGAACCEVKGMVPHDSETLGEGVGAGILKENTRPQGSHQRRHRRAGQGRQIHGNHRQVSRTCRQDDRTVIQR